MSCSTLFTLILLPAFLRLGSRPTYRTPFGSVPEQGAHR